MKKNVLTGLMLLIMSLGVFAQTGLVSGTITDKQGDPLPGVTVVEKGTSNGVVTNFDGIFEISSGNDAVLVVSFIGMQTKEVEIANQKELSIVLIADMTDIEEVIIVGYGAQKKESLTSAISNIKSDEILTTTHSSLAQALQGKVSGLQIRQNSGEPGRFDTKINIRGFGSPLYIIDGVARDGGTDFQKLRPEDIESISILKDASAAIYGLNAANGVIIVTTKKGSKGKTKFSYDGVTGITRPTDVPEMLNAYQYVNLVNHARANVGMGPSYTEEDVENYRIGAPGYEGTNWYNETFKEQATQQQHTLTAEGGNDDITFFTSLGFTDDQGLLKTGDLGYNQYSMRTNITAQLSKNLKANLIVSGRYDKRETPGTNWFTIFKATRTADPTARPFVNDNPLYLSLLLPNDLNPVAMADKDVSGFGVSEGYQFRSSLGLTYDVPFVKGLQVKGLYSFDNMTNLDKNLHRGYNLYSYDPETDLYTGAPQMSPDRITNSMGNNRRVNLQTQLVYQRTFSEDHNVGATVVYEQTKVDYRYTRAQREYDFFTNDQIDQASMNNQIAEGHEDERGSRSIISRVNYAYKGKYLLEFASRYDGTYRYHPDQQWGFFPVISAGWRISEESFMDGISAVVSNLKLRGSFGILGQDAGDPFQYVEGFTTDNGYGSEFEDGIYTTGIAAPAIVNKELTWFTSQTSNVGIDLGLWGGSVSLEVDAYQRYRTGLLARRNVSLPNTFGGELPQENLNSDMVRGIDAIVGLNKNIGDFYYGVSANVNYYRTQRVYVERGPFTNSMDEWRNGRANRYNDIEWGYVVEGQFQDMEDVIHSPLQQGSNGNSKELPGDFKYKDMNGDGVIDGNDRTPLFYNADPKLYYGMTFNCSYKGFDFTALIQGSAKYTVRFKEVYAQVFAFRGNTPVYFDDAWKMDEEGNWTEGTWPAPRYINDVGMMYAESEKWRKDASYLRLKTVDVGYTFRKQNWLNAVGIDRLRLYANGHNLFTFADPFVKPFDPEKIEGSYSAGFTYPLSKSYNIGVNISF